MRPQVKPLKLCGMQCSIKVANSNGSQSKKGKLDILTTDEVVVANAPEEVHGTSTSVIGDEVPDPFVSSFVDG